MVDLKKALRKHHQKVLNQHFKLPLHFDRGCFYVLDDKNVTVFECAVELTEDNCDYLENLIQKIVAKINGENNEFFLSDYNDPYLYVDGEKLLEVRGWGWLTSPSCEGLSDEEAAEYQRSVLYACCRLLGNI